MTDDNHTPGKDAAAPSDAADHAQQLAKIEKMIEGRKKSAAFGWDNFVSYGAGAGITGWMSQDAVSALIRSSTKNSLLENHETRKVYEALPAAEKQNMITKTLDAGPSKLARSMGNHAGSWKIGMAAVSVGAVLAWELWQQKNRAAEADQDIKDLKDLSGKLQKSWVERATEKSSDPSPSHHRK